MPGGQPRSGPQQAEGAVLATGPGSSVLNRNVLGRGHLFRLVIRTPGKQKGARSKVAADSGPP